MSSTTPAGLQNYSKISDRDKAYLFKILASIFGGLISGIVIGVNYDTENFIGTWNNFFFWFFFLLPNISLVPILKKQFNLEGMDNKKIFRHGIMVGFFLNLFFCTVVFNFFLF
ncbi:MAG: hypothetical protein OEY49_03395 [Candidatus Heimdallarchaeota archaeon]|nr:hypothetical protein [Candidatus Heimdallarchaeota archaeon]